MATKEKAGALLVDLDGVLRRWDPAVAEGIERRHGLAPGALLYTAMAWPLVEPAVAGQVDHAEWMAAVADALTDQAGDARAARAAVDEWAAYRGEVDPRRARPRPRGPGGGTARWHRHERDGPARRRPGRAPPHR